ncbi:hypothetical protein AT5A_27181 [Agrobacterium tumefaciens 5A]|nr:hypothetical protein AT5A_27181 [Agrobacterium tumefaciens 5A]
MRHDLASRRYEIDGGDVVMDEMLELAPGYPALLGSGSMAAASRSASASGLA